ncbi:MAG: hypothetical protein HYS22_02030 [Deltaproteobacteria bacterium]|nr:hypothetical protein [Deltaproteobacteria bacterium]
MERMLRVLNDLEQEGIIKGHALGGAMALLFYSEPTLTDDVDIFAYLPTKGHFIDLPRVYEALQKKGYTLKGEHFIIEGLRVQFLPADGKALWEEGVKEATARDFQGTQIRVISIEHLVAIMLDTNRPKDRARIGQLLEAEVEFDQKKLLAILTKYKLKERWEKIIGEEE